jgi:hypothetical protein
MLSAEQIRIYCWEQGALLRPRNYKNGMVRHVVGLWHDVTKGLQPKKAGLLFDRYLQGKAGGSFVDDYDLDTVANLVDNCPYVPNPGQLDGDDVGGGDGVGDACDNCVEVWNAIQWDWDQDGFGNACDGDLNNDTRVNAADRTILEACIGSPPEHCGKSTYVHPGSGIPQLLHRNKSSLGADLTGEGKVDASDLAAFDARYPDLTGNLHPGPSAARDARGLCAGSVPCPDPNSPL